MVEIASMASIHSNATARAAIMENIVKISKMSTNFIALISLIAMTAGEITATQKLGMAFAIKNAVVMHATMMAAIVR